MFDSDNTGGQRGDRSNVENAAILLLWNRPNLNDQSFINALNSLRFVIQLNIGMISKYILKDFDFLIHLKSYSLN